MPIETTLLALPVTDLALLGGLAAFFCMLGWQTRRLATRGREAAVQRSLFEAKGAVPQLESAVRHREQQAETLALQLKALKERVTEHETTIRQQETLIAKRDREIRSLNSELAVVKDGVSNDRVILDGDFDSGAPDGADPQLAKRHAALEARYEAMKRAMIQRDDRIAELEDTLRNPDGGVPSRTLEQELTEIEQTAEALKATLAERETQLEALQTRFQEEVAQREALEDLAKRRSEGNRELKANAAKFEQQIPALMKTIEAHGAEMAERNARLQAVSDDLIRERRAREAREAEIEDLQAQLAAALARQQELEQRLRELDEARRAVDAQLAETQEALRASEATVRAHETAIADAERRLAEARQSVEAGERAAAALRHAIEDRDFKIDGLETAARQQDAKLELLRSTFFEAKQAHKDHIAEITARHDAQRQMLEALTAEHDRLRSEATAHATHVARLERDIDDRDALARETTDLKHALARSHSALRQSQGTALLLIARMGSQTLLLPAPASEPAAAAALAPTAPTSAPGDAAGVESAVAARA